MEEEKQQSEPITNPAVAFPGGNADSATFPTEIDALPALKNWVPAPAFSFLGAFCWLIFWNVFSMVGAMAMVYAFAPNGVPPAVGFGVPAIAQAIFIVFYAAIFYPSYFTQTPILKSSRSISFMNYFMGGVVFGWCWNNNLKKSHSEGRVSKGISQIIAIVSYAFLIALSIFSMLPPLASSDSASKTATTQQNVESGGAGKGSMAKPEDPTKKSESRKIKSWTPTP